MKYHRLYITTDGTQDNYNEISKILKIKPTEFPTEKDDDNPFDLWSYCVDIEDDDLYYDFINKFLDILEPKLLELNKIGVTKDKIIFWLIYEYYAQCSLSLDAQEMKRLGENGIALNIDCLMQKEEDKIS